MSTKRVEISAAEATIVSGLLAERDLTTKMLTVAVQMICAREKIPVAMLQGMDGDAVLLDVPDEPAKPDRTELPTAPAGAIPAVPTAPRPETPSESKPAGKAEGLATDTAPPWAPKPAEQSGPVDSMGRDTGNYPDDLPGVPATIREHSGG